MKYAQEMKKALTEQTSREEKALIKKLSSNEKGEDVIFGGMIKEDETKEGERNFWTYIPITNELIGLPNFTNTPSVIEKIDNMQIGTVFNLVSYKAKGPLGMDVKDIDVDTIPKVIRLSDKKDATAKNLPSSIKILNLPCMKK